MFFYFFSVAALTKFDSIYTLRRKGRYMKLLFYRIGAIYAHLVLKVIPFALFQVANLARPSASNEKCRSDECANKCAPLKDCFILNDIIDILIASTISKHHIIEIANWILQKLNKKNSNIFFFNHLAHSSTNQTCSQT